MKNIELNSRQIKVRQKLKGLLQRHVYIKHAETVKALTPQQKLVIRHMGAGLCTKQIGERMSVSTKTIEYHRMKIYQVTGTTCQEEIIVFAFRSGVTPIHA